MRKPPASYRDAMTELQEIVDNLRDCQDVDVDELVESVTRAKMLIEFCEGKISTADTQVKSVIVELNRAGIIEDQVSEPAEPEPVAGGMDEEIPF